MEEEFVPYNQSIILKELGFDEECLALYYKEKLRVYGIESLESNKGGLKNNALFGDFITAPLWQQAFNWFKKEHKLKFHIYEDNWNHWCTPMILIPDIQDYADICDSYETYYEAQAACLNALCNIVEKRLQMKELILSAYSKGKTIQCNHSGKWHDFIPQNQLDKPNLDYGTIDNWRIKP